MSLPFIDLQAQRKRIETEVNAAILSVVESGRYVLGPEVTELEKQLAAWCGAKHSVSCANGTDAIALPLMAWEIGPGDAVFCPSFTFVATAQVVPWTGASPVFVGSRFSLCAVSSRVPGGFVPSQFAASRVVAPVAAVARTAN